MTANVFVAIEPSDAERHELAAALTDASPGPPLPGRRVAPENWHITVRFLGPAEELIIERLAHELDRSVDTEPFELTCCGLGTFPRASRASIIYAGVCDPTGSLDALAATCESACRDLGLAPEERPFVPHITLARVRPPVDVRSLVLRFGEFRMRIRVDRLAIMRSIPGRAALRYETLETLRLG